MAITCPRCGSEFDATLFQFGHRVRCQCGMEIEYPGVLQQAGHVRAEGSAPAVDHADRCIGCLLGKACGDILGAAVEGWPASEIRARHGAVRNFLKTNRGFGQYTDDTQMALALATSLVEHGRVDAARVSAKYAEFYEPWRGYGSGAHAVLQALREGGDYRTTGRMQFPEGSFGNGGAMRIAPLGLAYRHAPPDVLFQAVQQALLCTHVHPDAVDGAFVQATAVAHLSTTEPRRFDAQDLLRLLGDRSRTKALRQKLDVLREGLGYRASDGQVIHAVGSGILASEAVAAALWALVRYWEAPEECVVRAVGFGGDTDTVGALAGALVGALHGASWIPGRWYDNIENGRQGREEIVALARRLAVLDLGTDV